MAGERRFIENDGEETFGVKDFEWAIPAATMRFVAGYLLCLRLTTDKSVVDNGFW